MIVEFLCLLNEEELTKEETALIKYLRTKRLQLINYYGGGHGSYGEYSMESGISNLNRQSFKDNLRKKFKVKDENIMKTIEELVFDRLWTFEVIRIGRAEHLDEGSFYKFFKSMYLDYKSEKKEFENRLRIYVVEIKEEEIDNED